MKGKNQIMKHYQSNEIRNVAFLGHAGSGKTSLAEAMLFLSGATDRQGKTEDGNTICDFDAEEIRRKISISTAIAPIEWQNCKINIIDTPGLFDFEGEALEGLRAADCVVIAVSAKSGVSVGTEKAWKHVNKNSLPRAFFISKLDEELGDFNKVLEELKNAFGSTVYPIVVPFIGDDGKHCFVNLIEHKAYQYDAKGKVTEKEILDSGNKLNVLEVAISEAVAETSEELFEKYFSGEPFTREELAAGVHKGIINTTIAPVFCGSAITLAGIDLLLNSIVSIFPAGNENAHEIEISESGNETKIKVNEKDPVAVIIFKTMADPYVGKLSYFKVVSGILTSDSTVINARTGHQEKMGKLYMLRGKKQIEAEALSAGDIGAAAKMSSPLTGDTLCSPQRVINLKGINFPNPSLKMAVTPKNKGEEDKIAQGLHRLMEEDPTFKLENNAETHQQLIYGMGEQHLDVITSKLKAKFGVSVNLSQPVVAYRETIHKKVRVEGKHKKQTGGHGQFGHVWIEFEPCDTDDFIFEEKVVGGAVPRNFYPAVEKGLRESILHGVLAGFPVVNLKATLVDGSYHPVDSSEMAFKVAASLAFRNGLSQASPVLLEPLGLLKVYVPEANMGDIIGEVNKRRGKVMGMNSGEDGMQVIEAEAPMAEMHDFTTVLRSITQGRGNFTLEFQRYEEAPPMVVQSVIANNKHEEESAD
jgi:elongation factor G